MRYFLALLLLSITAMGATTPADPLMVQTNGVLGNYTNFFSVNSNRVWAVLGVTNLTGKVDATGGTASGLTLVGTTGVGGPISVNSTTISTNELSYLDGATGNIQAQIDAAVSPSFAGVDLWSAESGWAAWGDSLTQGAGGTAWPTQFATLSGLTIYNGGIGGETSTQIRTRFEAATNRWTNSTVIWLGRNNYSSSNTVLADLSSMVSDLGHNRYLVLGVINQDTANEYTNGVEYLKITQLNQQMADIFGDHYLDIRRILVDAYDSGDPGDVTDFANDVPPGTLRSDSLHLNTAGYGVVAQAILDQFDYIARQATNVVGVPLLSYVFANPPAIGAGTPAAVDATTLTADTVATDRINLTSGFIEESGVSSAIWTDKSWIAYTDNARDLGFSASQNRWRNLYLSGTAYIPTGYITNIYGTRLNLSSGYIEESGVSTAMWVNKSWIAYTDNASDLGFSASQNRWRNLYLSGSAYIPTGYVTNLTTERINLDSGFIEESGVSTAQWTSKSWIAYTDDAQDLGFSATQNRWRNLYLSGDALIGDALTVNGASVLNGSTTVSNLFRVFGSNDSDGYVTYFGDGAGNTNSVIALVAGVNGLSRQMTIGGDQILVLDADGTGTNYNTLKLGTSGTTVHVQGALRTGSGIELGDASDTTLSRESAGVVAIEGTRIPAGNGYKTIIIPASFFAATATSPATATTRNNTTNNTTDSVWSFSGSADNYITCSFPMPEKWDGSTLKAKFFWRSSSTSTNAFIWNIATGLASAGDNPDVTFSNTASVTNAGYATAYLQNVSSATGTVTPVGTPFVVGDTLRVLVGRDGDGDPNTDAALLEAVVLQYRETATEPSAW